MWTLALMSGSTNLENLQYSEHVAVLMELHFSHFFSRKRHDWTSEDIRYVTFISTYWMRLFIQSDCYVTFHRWFLMLANEQSHWKICYLQAPTLSANTNPDPTTAMPKECVPMTVFQFFLSRLLTKPNPTAHSLCDSNSKVHVGL